MTLTTRSSSGLHDALKREFLGVIMRAFGLAAVGLALVVLIAWKAAAQSARGVVVDSAVGRPLPGAVVVALDSAGNATARTLTDSAGQFTLLIARANRLRFVRIGYVPRELGIRDSGTVKVSMARLPAILSSVRVEERSICPNDVIGRGVIAWRMWEQVRAGLLGAVVASTVNPVTATSLLFRRRIDAYDNLVRRQSIEPRSGLATRPFIAAQPSRFVARGYLDEDSTGRTFYGPDADVLLDDSFAATHCFHMRAADANHRGQTGLAFTPIPERDTLVDVAGIIWVDSGPTSLRSLEFRYTGLEPAVMRAEAGGRIDFRSMRNGVIFVNRWSLRLPMVTRAVGAGPPPTPLRGKSQRMVNTGVRVSAIEEVGGTVTHAVWRDGVVWTAPPSRLTGVVRDAGTDTPIRAAVVSLDGTASVALSDRDGEYMLAPVLPGRYTMSVVDTSLSRYASARRMNQIVDIGHDQLARISPRVESVAGVAADICTRQRSVRSTKLIVGRIVPTSTTTTVSGRLRASWMSQAGDSATAEGAVERDGRFLLCGPTSEAAVALHLDVGHSVSDTTIDAGYTRVTSVEWRPTLHEPALASQARLIRGVVVDSGLRPIARVSIAAPSLPTVFTDDSGAFRLTLPTRDATVLQFLRFGFAPMRFGLGPGSDTSVSAMMLRAVQQLEAISVKASGTTTAKLRGFEERAERRARGITFGTFVTAEQIEKRNPTRITQMFQDIPFIRVQKVHPNFERYALFARSSAMGVQCAVSVFIDGVRVMEGGIAVGGGRSEAGVAIDDLVPPESVAGVEVYRTGADAPPQFQALNGTCAVVAIWTK